MEYKFLLVKLANPYNRYGGISGFDIFDLSKDEAVCLYIAEYNRNHNGLISLTPISVYAAMFPVDSIKETEFRKLNNKRTFNVSTEFYKAQEFADYVNKFIHYLNLCKENPNLYYISYGKNIIKNKKGKYFINGAHYFYGELINMIFRSVCEYEPLKLKKYNIFKRLFK